MNAIEALEKTNLTNQGSLSDVEEMIMRAVKNGSYHCYYSKSISDEDIKLLTDEGYKVIAQKPLPPGFGYYFEISWHQAK